MNSLFTELASWLDDKRTPRLEGWCTLEKAEMLAMAAMTLRPMVAVEIGVWAGRSVLPVALVMRETGQGTFHAIDPWSPDASAEGYGRENADWWLKHADHQYAKKQFLQMLNSCRLESIVKVHAAKSDDVITRFPDGIDMLHIDGQHTLQACRDVRRFAFYVNVGGIVVMDDILWQNDGRAEVGRAVEELVDMGFKKLFGAYRPESNYEFYQRVK